jgi:hypothetical protein
MQLACHPVIANPQGEAIHARTLDCFTLRVRNDVRDNLNCTRENFSRQPLIFTYRNIFIPFLIHPDSTFFDLAGTVPACLPDAAVLPTAGSDVTPIPALSVTAYGNIPEAIPAGIRRRHGSISTPFSRIDSIGNIIRQPHLL